MKIKFTKKYDDDSTWCVIVEDFLKELSEQYGYHIDVFDMMALPDMIIQDRIGRLLDDNPKSLTYKMEFMGQVKKTFESRKLASAVRKRRKAVFQAMDIYQEEDDENSIDD